MPVGQEVKFIPEFHSQFCWIIRGCRVERSPQGSWSPIPVPAQNIPRTHQVPKSIVCILLSDRLCAVTASLPLWGGWVSLSLEHASVSMRTCQQSGEQRETAHVTLMACSDTCLSTFAELWLWAEQYLTDTHLRDARGGFHSRAPTALPRSHLSKWFGPWFINQLSLSVALKTQCRVTSIGVWNLWD